jgi:hypothetical protein
MPSWRFNSPEWDDADRYVWDRLGGRESLELSIGASGFTSSRWTVRSKEPPTVIRVWRAECTYRDCGGRRRLFRVTESHMTGVSTPSLVIAEVRPSPWTLDWLLWSLNPKGDADTNRHRSSFYVGRLKEISDDGLRQLVEGVLEMRTDPFCYTGASRNTL